MFTVPPLHFLVEGGAAARNVKTGVAVQHFGLLFAFTQKKKKKPQKTLQALN